MKPSRMSALFYQSSSSLFSLMPAISIRASSYDSHTFPCAITGALMADLIIIGFGSELRNRGEGKVWMHSVHRAWWCHTVSLRRKSQPCHQTRKSILGSLEEATLFLNLTFLKVVLSRIHLEGTDWVTSWIPPQRHLDSNSFHKDIMYNIPGC